MISIATSSSFSSANFVSPKVIASNSNSNYIKSRSLRISASCTSTAERTGSHTTSSSSASSLYEVLGIQAGATCQEIKTAYRRLARVVHPDVSSNGQRGCQTSAGEFMKVHDAYATLSDPEKRADYDRMLYSQGEENSEFSIGDVHVYGYDGFTICWIYTPEVGDRSMLVAKKAGRVLY